jgi:ArsR family transcriptional regulator
MRCIDACQCILAPVPTLDSLDEALATRLKALADPARLRIVEFLQQPDGGCCAREDGVCGCDFEDLLGLSQPTVSHHLKILVQAGLLKADKRGRWMYYELEPDAFADLARFFSRFEATPARC